MDTNSIKLCVKVEHMIQNLRGKNVMVYNSFSHHCGGILSYCCSVRWGLRPFLCVATVFLSGWDMDFQHSNLFLFQTFLLCDTNFFSGENREGCALFSNMFWLHVLLIWDVLADVQVFPHRSFILDRQICEWFRASQQQQELVLFSSVVQVKTRRSLTKN